MIVHPPTQAVDAQESESNDQTPVVEEDSDDEEMLWSVSEIVRPFGHRRRK